MKSILITFLLILAIFSTISSQTGLDGTWKTQELIMTNNNQYLQKAYTFSGERWENEVMYFQDSDLTKKIYKIRSLGSMVKIIDSGVTSFVTEQKYLTIQTDDQNIIEELGFNYCPLIKDEEKDITESGCAFIRSAARTNPMNEKINLAGNLLNLGKKSALERQ